MLEFMEMALGAVEDAVKAGTPELLAAAELVPVREYLRAFRFVMPNPPTVWVMPGKTYLSDEGQSISQVHEVTVKIGIVGPDPETLMRRLVVPYVRAVDEALRAAQMPVGVKRVWIKQHDYGPLRAGNQAFAMFPDVDLMVETEEVE